MDILFYEVKEQDTLFKISKKFNTTVYKIMDDNLLTNTSIFIGQVLIIYV